MRANAFGAEGKSEGVRGGVVRQIGEEAQGEDVEAETSKRRHNQILAPLRHLCQ